jgi:hypothetical protein
MPGPVLVLDAVVLPSPLVVAAVIAFHHLVTWRRPDANLVVSGRAGDAEELAALGAFVRRLNLSACWLLSDGPDDVRAACWERADLAIVVGDPDAPVWSPAATAAGTARAFGTPVLRWGDDADADVATSAPPRFLAEALARALERVPTCSVTGAHA